MKDKRATIEQPTKATPKAQALEARMFVMPEQYRHGAQAAMHQPESAQAVKPAVEIQTPAVPAPKAPPKAVVPPKKQPKKGGATKWILIIGALFLLILGAGAWYVLSVVNPSTQTEPEVEVEVEEPVTRPEPVVEEPDVEVEEPDVEPEVKDPFGGQVTPGTDTDSDGLTDVEEEVVYQTNTRLPDSDSDGFLDGNEVFHRYNPNGTAPGTLIGSGLVTMLWGQAGSVFYELNYPTIWDIETTQEEIILAATTGEGFRIRYTSKQPQQSLDAWVSERGYEDYSSGVSKNGLVMIQTEDQLTNFIDLGFSVLTFVYDTGIKTRVDYLQTYQMMLNSIQILSASEIADRELVDTPEAVSNDAEEVTEEVEEDSTESTDEEEVVSEEEEESDEDVLPEKDETAQ